MRVLRLKTSRLALIFSMVTLAAHLGIGFLLLAVIKNPALAGLWHGSMKVYWPVIGFVQLLGLNFNVGYITAMATMPLAALFQWWVFFCVGIWTVRLYFREPPISKVARFAIPVLALVFAVCFYRATPEAPGMSKYDRFRVDVSIGNVERVRETLQSNPGFANKVRPGWGTALHEAARSGHPDTAEQLLKDGSDVNARNGEGETPLHVAAKWGGHIEVARLLIAHKADLNARNNDGRTALWSAAAGGHINLIVLLLENGADVNAEDKNRNCPLSGAIMNNRYGVVPLLLSHGANPTVSDLSGDSMLDRAAIQGSPALAESLLPYFKDTNAAKYLSKSFSTAFQFGHMDVAVPISVSALRFESHSIHEAAFSGNTEAILSHISSEPDTLNAKDFLGLTPLHRAAQAGQGAAVKLLLTKGAAVDSTDQEGNTPLHWAVFTGQSNVVEMLIQNRATLEAKGAGKYSALHLAVQQGFLPLSEMLLKAGANPDIATQYGETPMCLAVAAGDVEAVKLLLGYKADLSVNRNGDGLFHIWAEGSGNLAIADLLLEKGCDLNARGREGRRPIHALLERTRFQADEKGQLKVIQWLLDHNVDVNAKSDNGQTPLSLLKWKNRGRTIERRKDIGDLLRTHGAKE